jgi:tetratricopeptide (TPR) repeat protein
VAAAVFAYFSSQRAHRLEREAQQSRANAEELLGYLSDDFGRELESFGQLDVLSEFSQRQIDYFDALPPAQRGTETVRNAALAMVMHSRAKRALGKLDVAGEDADEAVDLLTKLRTAGDSSEATTIALSLAYAAQGRVLESRSDPKDLETSQRGLALLEPLVKRPDASPAARRAYVEVGFRVGFELGSANHPEDAVRTEEDVMRIAEAMGARELRDLDMGAYYAEAGGWRVTALESLGRYDEARRIGAEALRVADAVLERRPGYRLALHAEGITTSALGQVAQDELDPKEALRIGMRQEEVASTLLKLDPANIVSINNLAVAEAQLQYAYWTAGRLHESMPHRVRQFEIVERATAGGATFYINYAGAVSALVDNQAATGDAAGARATMARAEPVVERLRASEPEGSTVVALVAAEHKADEAFAALYRDDLPTALSSGREAVREAEAVAPQNGTQKFTKSILLHYAYDALGEAQYRSGDFGGAEHSEALAVDLRRQLGTDAMDDRRRLNFVLIWEAMAKARQDNKSDAARTIAPVVKFERELAAKNHGDQWVALDLASALYVQALAEPARRAALLAEALSLINGLAPELRPLHDTLQWRARILEAQRQG